MRAVRSGHIIFGALLIRATLFAQAPASEHPVVINFIADVNSDSVNTLVRIINDQVIKGNHKITILISSGGGQTAPALAAYNLLRHMSSLELTTFNIGNVDSAAMLLYCAGAHRYSLPGPGTRFLIHGNAMNPPVGVPIDVTFWESQVQLLKSLNEMTVRVIAEASNDRRSDIEAAVHSQKILSPELAKEWGIVQDIREDFMPPGATFIAVNVPEQGQKRPPDFVSITSQ